MSKYNGRPNIVRDWIREKLNRWKKFLDERIKVGVESKELDEETTRKNYKEFIPADKIATTLKQLGITDEDGKASLGQLSDHDSDFGDVDYLQFIDDDDDDEFKSLKGKNLLGHRAFGKNNKRDEKEQQQKYFANVIGHHLKDSEVIKKRVADQHQRTKLLQEQGNKETNYHY